MPSGGHNRFPGKIAAQRGTERRADRARPGVGAAPGRSPVPKPPRTVKGVERRVWLEMAEQVNLVDSYNPACFTQFRMMVKTGTALEIMDPMKTKPTAYAQLQRAMRGWLASFGLTAAEQAAPPAPGQSADRFGSGAGADPVEAFLFGRATLAVVKGGKGG